MTTDGPVTERDLLRWAESLAAIARTGLGFTESLYEQERFEEILSVAGEIRSRAADGYDQHDVVAEWLGFRPVLDAGKVMGLASYGNPEAYLDRFERFCTVTGRDHAISLATKSHHGSKANRFIVFNN